VRIHRSWPTCATRSGSSRAATGRRGPRPRAPDHDELFGTGQIDEAEWSQRCRFALAGATRRRAAAHPPRLDAATNTGIGALIDELHRNGFETACLSKLRRSLVRLLHQDDAGRPLPARPSSRASCACRHFASHILGLAKPDPAILRAFEAATGHAGTVSCSSTTWRERYGAAQWAGTPSRSTLARDRGPDAPPPDPARHHLVLLCR